MKPSYAIAVAAALAQCSQVANISSQHAEQETIAESAKTNQKMSAKQVLRQLKMQNSKAKANIKAANTLARFLMEEKFLQVKMSSLKRKLDDKEITYYEYQEKIAEAQKRFDGATDEITKKLDEIKK